MPEHSELRTFAIERIRQAAADKLTFEMLDELETDPYANSLGIYRGPAVKVRLRFAPALADRLKERTWHPSQQFRDRTDGATDMTLSVSDDYALRSWILSFGSGVRVLAPASLVQWAMDELESSRRLYPEGERRPVDPNLQPVLPFSLLRLPTA